MIILQKELLGAGETAQQLITLTAMSEDMGSMPRTNTVAYSHI